MPELPEVERARKSLESLAKGKKILKIDAKDDTIVFSGVTAAAFATDCLGKTVMEVKRKGKNFYMVLSASPHPIFHFGMSGNSSTRGLATPVYRVPRANSDDKEWPPKYTIVTITFADEQGKECGEWAFSDPRRLGRIKMVEDNVPEEGEFLKSLGADPLLDMPPVGILEEAFGKRHAPIKAVLLDQNGPLCGLGNWMVDEILYQARIHPTYPTSSLSLQQITEIHRQIVHVTTEAVKVNADASLFPKDWLFSARWGKGKKGGKNFVLPSGESADITFVTVGGRTSAVILALQPLPSKVMSAQGVAPPPKKSKKRKVDVEGTTSTQTSPHFEKEEEKVDLPLSTPKKFKLPTSLVSPTPQVKAEVITRRETRSRKST